MKLPSIATIRLVIDCVRTVAAAARRPQPRAVEDALRDAPSPEDLARWRAAGGGIAPPDAPHIEGDGKI